MKIKILFLSFILTFLFAIPLTNATMAVSKKVSTVVSRRLMQRVPAGSIFPEYVTEVVLPVTALGTYGVAQNGTVHKAVLAQSMGITYEGLANIFTGLDLGMKLPIKKITSPKEIIDEAAERISIGLVNSGIDQVVAYALIQDALTGLLLWTHNKTANNSFTVQLPGRPKPVPVNNISGVYTLARIIEGSSNPQIIEASSKKAADIIAVLNYEIDSQIVFEGLNGMAAVIIGKSMERFAFVVYDTYLRSLKSGKNRQMGIDPRIKELFSLYKKYCERFGNDLDAGSELKFTSWVESVKSHFENTTLTYGDDQISILSGKSVRRF